jgi:hypothetical protein
MITRRAGIQARFWASAASAAELGLKNLGPQNYFFWVVCTGYSSKQEAQKANVSNKKKSSVFLLVVRIFLMDFDDID